MRLTIFNFKGRSVCVVRIFLIYSREKSIGVKVNKKLDSTAKIQSQLQTVKVKARSQVKGKKSSKRHKVKSQRQSKERGRFLGNRSESGQL